MTIDPIRHEQHVYIFHAYLKPWRLSEGSILDVTLTHEGIRVEFERPKGQSLTTRQTDSDIMLEVWSADGRPIFEAWCPKHVTRGAVCLAKKKC